MNPVDVFSGNSPVVLGLPHTGTFVPKEIFEDLTPLGQTLSDTDWHIHRLYGGLLDGASTVRATFHRYVIDANRDPSGVSLYPDQNTTGLVPLTDFDGEPLWTISPNEAEIERRRSIYHAAYHNALQAEMERVRDLHGVAILYDCHSIRSNIPFLFDGVLPDFNIGTNNLTTCAPEIQQVVENICSNLDDYTSVTNGRFKGGWTTRHYGKQEQGFHAVQMELAQSTHLMSEKLPYAYHQEKAQHLRATLKEILKELADLAPSIRGD